MLLLDMDPAYLNWNLLKQTMRPLSKKEPNWALQGLETFTKPAFLIANSGVALDGEPIVEGIIQGFGKPFSLVDGEVNIFRGKAGDD